MWPASASTTIPSGSFRPSLTIVFKSEPSGFAERMRPAPRSKKKRRPEVDLAAGFASFGLVTVDAIEFACSFANIHSITRHHRKRIRYLDPRGTRKQTDENALQEGTQAGHGLADNQVLHLVGAFVGVEGFGVGEEASHVVVGDDAVSAAHLAGPSDRLAALGRAERFRECRMRVGHLSFGLQLSHANHQALRSSNVAEHLGEEILHELKRADRFSKLQALLRVLESVLVGAHGTARRFPADEIEGATQDPGCVPERVIFLKTVLLRHPAVLQRDLTVLDYLECNLVLHLFNFEARSCLVLDDESPDLIVGEVARPNN